MPLPSAEENYPLYWHTTCRLISWERFFEILIPRQGFKTFLKVKKLKTIHGIPIPSAWDGEGKVLSITIAAFDEQKYLVAKNSMTQEFLSYLQKPVIIEGIVTKKNKQMLVEVKTIKAADAPF